jgi:formyl-CoA transferase
MAGALEGLRVLDCTHVIAGAWCSLLLADFGADVIKIERPEGEQLRGGRAGGFVPFDMINRNKRAIAVDFSKPEGAAVIRKLVESADVFVENYRPGALARSGLGYDDLKKIKPNIIYCSVSGFGQTGPYQDRGGFDLVAQAMSGIMSFIGEIGGKRPVSTGVPITDLNAGMYGALAVMAALQHRARTGEGQYVETSLFEAGLAYTVWETGQYLAAGTIAKPNGARHRLTAPYEPLRTKDGYIVVGVNTQRLWEHFCEVLGDPTLEKEELFKSGNLRVANRDTLEARLEKILMTQPTDYWVERCLAVGIPCGPINTIDKALADPQIVAREMLATVEGGRRFLRTPVMMSETPVKVKRGPSAIGGDTSEVLREAGFSAAEIEALADKGAVKLAEHAEVKA